MIRFENISKQYKSDFHALKNINLHIKKGELIVLIGPSGSGKTTTMKMINRLIEPSAGKIYINGQDIHAQDPVLLRRNIGYVIQHIGLLPHMTIAENVGLVPRLQKRDPQSYLNRVHELLEMVHLDPKIYATRYPSELSGGQQQRVGVVRALAADPDIILMDEPFSALDPISREQLQDELLRLQETIHKTIVFVTHDIDEAIKIADRICLLNHGEIVQINTPEQILRHPANDFVRAFIGESRLNQVVNLPSLQEIMVKPIVSRPNRGLTEAIIIMQKQKVDSLLIVDKDNKLLGVAGVWEIHQHFQDESLTLADIMTLNVPTVNISESLADAIQLINQNKVAYLPVLNDQSELLGVITRASLVNFMAKHLETRSRQEGLA